MDDAFFRGYYLLWTTTTDHEIGLGWFICEDSGVWEVSHSGSDLGFRSDIMDLVLPVEAE
jgi:hypothetical protein